MKIVGLLCGREYSFPPAFIARVNQLDLCDQQSLVVDG